nr:MAG TPA: hypothetical protein [Caudoviricetes sp.]
MDQFLAVNIRLYFFLFLSIFSGLLRIKRTLAR